MSRGPLPSKGFDAALPVARARGHVEHFRRMRGSTADIMVSGGGILAIIRLQNAPRLYGTIAEIALEFYDAIARLRLHPAGGPVSRELWLYSRYGVLRFFRVLDDGIVEIGADGKEPAPVSGAPVAAGKEQDPGKKPAEPEPVPVPDSPGSPAAYDIPVLPQETVAEENPGGERE